MKASKIIVILKERIAVKQRMLQQYKEHAIRDLDTIDTRVFESNMATILMESAKLKAEIDEDEFLLNLIEQSN